MTNAVSLFLQQSYQDDWESYQAVLRGDRNMALWDDIVLTASNERQAAAYKAQIDYRLAHGQLPQGTRYAVLPDPMGKRVGSGGATFSALRHLLAQSPVLKGRRMLVIHSGGDSKRIPQYSACGKLFSPVPRVLPDGRRSTLFDEFIIGTSGLANRLQEGMMVCSGDVLLLYNPLQIEFYGTGAAALSIKEAADTGSHHGVYLRNKDGLVERFLHKQSVETLSALGAVDARGRVDIDTGSVLLGTDILSDLAGLIDTEQKFHAFVNERARLSFYADFLYPLANGSTLEAFYDEQPEGEFTPELRACREALWNTLHRHRMRLLRLSPASFIHFGTTRELLQLMTQDLNRYQYLGWQANVITNSQAAHFAASGSYISKTADVGADSYIEDSYIYPDACIGRGCVIAGVTLKGECIPDGAVLHALKLEDGRFVARVYGVLDNPKEPRLFGQILDEPLWSSALYPVCETIPEAVTASLRHMRNAFKKEPGFQYISLKDSYERANLISVIEWQEKLEDTVRVDSLLDAIDNREFLDKAVETFHHGFSERAHRLLLQAAGQEQMSSVESFSRKVRIYRALSKLTDGVQRERYHDLCFHTIREAVLSDAAHTLAYDRDCVIKEDEVVVRLPLRINGGGGWSDTPPYCLEHGGTVLNAAITLGEGLPVEAVIRRVEGNKIILSSADTAAFREFTETAPLQDSNNPQDPFALHKASLIACGFIPRVDAVPLKEILERLGGGFALSTQVIDVPRGSGLGTSSILAGACVKAVMSFLGKTVTNDELHSRVMYVEQLMSTGGGWQDQVGGLTPGIKIIKSNAGLTQKVQVIPLQISDKTIAELKKRVCLIYTGQRRLARNLLREVVGRYLDSHPQALEVLYEIQRLAVLMRFELEKGNVDRFAQLMSRHWELSKQLDAGCTNTCIDQIFLSIDNLIDGKMICGAGGGGFLQIVLKKDKTIDELRERIEEVFGDSGAEVWACNFYC